MDKSLLLHVKVHHILLQTIRLTFSALILWRGGAPPRPGNSVVCSYPNSRRIKYYCSILIDICFAGGEWSYNLFWLRCDTGAKNGLRNIIVDKSLLELPYSCFLSQNFSLPTRVANFVLQFLKCQFSDQSFSISITSSEIIWKLSVLVSVWTVSSWMTTVSI